MTREQALQLVTDTLRETAESLGLEDLDPVDEETRLYGQKSALDSLGLVTLLADLEEKTAAEHGVDIVLADERALSQKASPFRRVGTLADHLEARVREARPASA